MEKVMQTITEVDGTSTYYGEAQPGTAKTAPNWRIKRALTTGGVVETYFPVSESSVGMPTSNYNFRWADRKICTYTDTKDTTAPTLTSAAKDSVTHITVTLSELLKISTITKANAGGFVVAQTGTPATTYAVSAIAPGTTYNQVVLTVANMTASAAAGVKVTYSATGNGTVSDAAGNILATNATGVVIAAW